MLVPLSFGRPCVGAGARPIPGSRPRSASEANATSSTPRSEGASSISIFRLPASASVTRRRVLATKSASSSGKPSPSEGSPAPDAPPNTATRQQETEPPCAAARRDRAWSRQERPCRLAWHCRPHAETEPPQHGGHRRREPSCRANSTGSQESGPAGENRARPPEAPQAQAGSSSPPHARRVSPTASS